MRILHLAVSMLFAAPALAQSATPTMDPNAPQATPQGTMMTETAPATTEQQAQEAVRPTPPPAVVVVKEVKEKEHMPPLAGYNGGFFLRDPHDWFVLFPKGRLQVDSYNFLNRGDPAMGVAPNSAGDARPRNSIFVRRARIEVQGTVVGHFDFQIGAEFTSTPAAGAQGNLADAFVIVDYLSFLKLQAGQFDAPFSLENRTSDKFLDFMERGTSVRYLAVPTNKDQGVMLWGWLPRKSLYYSIGWFNGDGQNFRNQDNNGAIIGRTFFMPMALVETNKWMSDVEVGASVWWQRNNNLGGPIAAGSTQNDLSGMSTPGGFSFFSSSYNMPGAAGAVRAHLVPNGDTTKWALEARAPVWKFGLQWELMHVQSNLQTYYDVTTGARGPVGKGLLDGYGWYLEAFAWILGDVSFIETPGIEAMARLKKFGHAKPPTWGLRAIARYEHVGFNVGGLPYGNDNPASGNYALHTMSLGLDGWATKHVRLTANYFLNYVDGDAPAVTKNFYFKRFEHELLFRAAINL